MIHHDNSFRIRTVLFGEISPLKEWYFHGGDVVRSGPVHEKARRFRDGGGLMGSGPEWCKVIHLIEWDHICSVCALNPWNAAKPAYQVLVGGADLSCGVGR